MTDALLAEIAAHPESDDARLVWADREGGDRGELVVVQCTLASGAGDRETRRRLYRREPELLAKAQHWPGVAELDAPRFERGFIVHAITTIDALPKELARHPLLTSIELADARIDVRNGDAAPPWHHTGIRIAKIFESLAPGRVTRIKADPLTWTDDVVPILEDHLEEMLGALSSTHAGRALRGLELVRAFPREAFTWLTHWKELEELRIVCDGYGLSGLGEFLRTHPRLHRLQLRRQVGDMFGAPAITTDLESLTELDVARGFDGVAFLHLAGMKLPKLRRLGLPSNHAMAHAYRALAEADGLAQIEELDVSGAQFDDAKLAHLANAKFAPNLRVLELRDTNKLTAAAIPLFLSFPKLDRLDLRSSYGDTKIFAPLKDVIPWVAL